MTEPSRSPSAGPEQGELFTDGTAAVAPRRNRGHKVLIRPDPTGQGYALFDAVGRRLFGTLRFSTEAAAAAYLTQANREARWVKWHLVRPRRPERPPASMGRQPGLFEDK